MNENILNQSPNNDNGFSLQQSKALNTPGYFEATRTDDGLELICRNINAFVLAYVIACRANWRGGFNRHGCDFGEAFVGDFKNCGMSERNYRTAKVLLAKENFATFRTTNKGTIAKLNDTRLFKINPPKNDERPTGQRRPIDRPPTANLNLKSGKPEIYKAFPTKESKLSDDQKELAGSIEGALGDQWVNDAGKWIGRIKSNIGKSERVIAELVNAIKERRIRTTPAQYAEEIWKRFV